MPSLACAAASAQRASTRCEVLAQLSAPVVLLLWHKTRYAPTLTTFKPRPQPPGCLLSLGSASLTSQAHPDCCTVPSLFRSSLTLGPLRWRLSSPPIPPAHPPPPPHTHTARPLQRGPLLHLLCPQPQRRPGHHPGHLPGLVPRHEGLGGAGEARVGVSTFGGVGTLAARLGVWAHWQHVWGCGQRWLGKCVGQGAGRPVCWLLCAQAPAPACCARLLV